MRSPSPEASGRMGEGSASDSPTVPPAAPAQAPHYLHGRKRDFPLSASQSRIPNPQLQPPHHEKGRLLQETAFFIPTQSHPPSRNSDPNTLSDTASSPTPTPARNTHTPTDAQETADTASSPYCRSDTSHKPPSSPSPSSSQPPPSSTPTSSPPPSSTSPSPPSSPQPTPSASFSYLLHVEHSATLRNSQKPTYAGESSRDGGNQ